jgi:hypothetical protein
MPHKEIKDMLKENLPKFERHKDLDFSNKSILDIKTDLSEAFTNTRYSKSKPFESVNPPKQGNFPQLIPTEIKEIFSNNDKGTGTLSIDRNQTKFKISDFSAGDIIHTQPYISQEIRREVRFPTTQIKDHILRIGKFLDSQEGSLFIANQAMLQAFNVMPKSFAGLTAKDGVYKVYKSDNTRFSPIGIRGSSIPGFHIERHQINRSKTVEAYGRFAIDIGGTRSTYLTTNFPNLAPNKYRMDNKAVGIKAKSAYDILGSGFVKRMQPAFENQMMSIVEQAFTNPRKLSIKAVGSKFQSLAAESIGGAFGDLLGAGAKSLTEQGTEAISDFFGGFNSNLKFGKSKFAKLSSAVVNTGANIIVDTISNVAQKTFAEQVRLQTTKAGVWVGKRLGIDPKFVTNSIQAAFSKDAIVVSQVSPTNKLNKYNILAPYYEASKHTDGEDVSVHVINAKTQFSGDFIRAGYGRDPESRKLGMEGFMHISRVSLINESEANIIAKNPDTIYKNEDILGHAGAHRQISYRVLPYSLLKTDDNGLGEWHPEKLANPDAEGIGTMLEKEKAWTLGRYSEGRGNDGLQGYREDNDFGVMKPSAKSDQVTLHRPKDDNDKLVSDFVHFAFHDTVNKKHIQFRAILGAITDTIRPEWDPIKYLGRPDQVYMYKGAIRNINFTFKIAAFTKQELIFGWEKLNYLVGLAYPSKYQEGGIGGGQMVAPLVKLTIGGMFVKTPGLINNISLTVPDQSPWDINPNLELPKYVEASVDFQYIGDNKLETQSKHYGLPFMDGDGPLNEKVHTTIQDVEKSNQAHTLGGDGRVSERVKNTDKFESFRNRLLG